jgi:hypothetical protein
MQCRSCSTRPALATPTRRASVTTQPNCRNSCQPATTSWLFNSQSRCRRRGRRSSISCRNALATSCRFKYYRLFVWVSVGLFVGLLMCCVFRSMMRQRVVRQPIVPSTRLYRHRSTTLVYERIVLYCHMNCVLIFSFLPLFRFDRMDTS